MGSDYRMIEGQEDALSAKLDARVKRSERALDGMQIFLVLGGAFAAALSPLLPANLSQTYPVATIIGICGAALAFLGGAIMVFVEKGAGDDLRQAQRALTLARQYLAEREQLSTTFQQARDLDEKRRHLIAAQQTMLEYAELSFLKRDWTVDSLMRGAVKSGQRSLLAAMGIRAGENYTISVYGVGHNAPPDELGRVARFCADRQDEDRASRTWKLGEGYTGAAWLRARDVVIEDTTDPKLGDAYHVPGDKSDEEDSSRYRSIASFPIKVGEDKEIWGVLTVSSNRPGRFSPDRDSAASQNVEVPRTLAKLLELLAAFVVETHIDQGGKAD